MVNAAAPYAAFLQAASARAHGASGGARAVAAAFEAARDATINPAAIFANRNAFVQAARSNIFGFNTHLLASLEGLYDEFWAADVQALAGYHAGASQAVAHLASWQQTLQGLPGIGQLFGGAPAAAPAAP